MLKLFPAYDERFLESQKTKIKTACDLVNETIASKEFETAVLATQFTTTNLSSFEVMDKIKHEDFIVISLKLWVIPWYRRYTSAIAYEAKDGIHIRDSYLSNCHVSDLAGTIIHESMHTLGFSHDFFNTKRRPMSVPYKIGNIVIDLIRAKKP